ncbi:MAG: hypothetical protein ACXACC_10090 [Promethearchaeota archaeon]|jgi:hypothetical protein
MENQSFMDPNFIPEEYKVPYDILELPSQGLLYPNKKSKVKVEYLTAYDENVLTSPNILNSGKLLDVLIERKVKDLGFDHSLLLEGDRMAIVLFLRVSAFGEKYIQPVIDPKSKKLVEGEVDLSTLKNKPLTVKPDEEGLFDFKLPKSDKSVKFRLLTGKDEEEIDETDKQIMERNKNDVSTKTTLRLERSIMEIDGERDKMKISHILKMLPIMDIRKLNKYMGDIEPGVDFKTTARTQGGESVPCFLRINKNLFWPEF